MANTNKPRRFPILKAPKEALERQSVARRDATATRFTPAQRVTDARSRLRWEAPVNRGTAPRTTNGHNTRRRTAREDYDRYERSQQDLLRAEEREAQRRREEYELNEERRRKRKEAQKRREETAQRYADQMREQEWSASGKEDIPTDPEDRKIYEEVKKQIQEENEAKQKRADALYEKEYKKFYENGGKYLDIATPINNAGSRLAFWLKNAAGMVGYMGADAHVEALGGKIDDKDIDIQSANAYRQTKYLQEYRKQLMDSYDDITRQLNSGNGRNTKDLISAQNSLASQIAETDKLLGDKDLQQLTRMFKYNKMQEYIGETDSFAQNVQDALFSLTSTLTTTDAATRRREQRLNEAEAWFDKYEGALMNTAKSDAKRDDYINWYNNQRSRDTNNYEQASTIPGRQNIPNMLGQTPEEQKAREFAARRGIDFDRKYDEKNPVDTMVDKYVEKKNIAKDRLKGEIIGTRKFQDSVDKFFNIAEGVKLGNEAYQDEKLYDPNWWKYCFAPMVGSSNSSPELIAGNVLEYGSMLLGPNGYVAGQLLSTPLLMAGGLEENYGETGGKRIENLKNTIESTVDEEVLSTMMKDLKKQSSEFWKLLGFDDEWIKDHVSNTENLYSDLAKGFIHNNSPQVRAAMVTSTKGLRAQRQADNVRTMYEIPVQIGMSLAAMPKWAAKAAWQRIKDPIKAGTKKVGGKLVATSEGKAVDLAEDAANSGRKFANGFSRPEDTLWQSIKKGAAAGSEAGERLGLGVGGSAVGGVIGGTAGAVKKGVRWASPRMAQSIDDIEETFLRKYQKIYDKLLSEKEGIKLIQLYGGRAIKNAIPQAISEATEEGVQYLNSKKDFASIYGYDVGDYSDMIASDMEQGARVTNAYLSLLGLTHSELDSDAEFWNNVKGGFAMGGHNPGFNTISSVYNSVNAISKEASASEVILRSGIMNREMDKINRASGAELAKLTMQGKGDATIGALERMKAEDSRRAEPKFSEDVYDARIEEAKGIKNLTNDKTVRAQLEAKGIKYGTDRYATAIADIYSLLQQHKAAADELTVNQQKRDAIYSSKEFNDEADSITDQVLGMWEYTNPTYKNGRLEAGEKAVRAYEAAAAQNGEDVNTTEFKESLIKVRADAEKAYNDRYRAFVRRGVVERAKLTNKLTGLLQLKAKSNTADDIFDFMRRKLGTKSKRPDATVIQKTIDERIKQAKLELSEEFKNFKADFSDEEALQFLNEMNEESDAVGFGNQEAIDLESAATMLQADMNVTEKYMSLYHRGTKKDENGKVVYDGDVTKDPYGRRVDAIMEANSEHQKSDWMMNDIYLGDAATKLQEEIDKQDAEELKKRIEEAKKQKEQNTVPTPTSEQLPTRTPIKKIDKKQIDQVRRAEMDKNKEKYRKRKAKAIERHKRHKRAIFGSSFGSIFPLLGPVLHMSSKLIEGAEITGYKFAELVSNLKAAFGNSLDVNDYMDYIKDQYNARVQIMSVTDPETAAKFDSEDVVNNYKDDQISDIAPETEQGFSAKTQAARDIQTKLNDEAAKVNTKLSTYHDIIVEHDGTVEIYPNTAEIDIRELDSTWKTRYESVLSSVKSANTSKDNLLTFLANEGIDTEYANYYNVDGINEMIARHIVRTSHPSITIGDIVRRMVVNAFVGNDTNASIAEEELEQFFDKEKIDAIKQDLQVKIKNLTDKFDVVAVMPHVYGKDKDGKKMSSQMDLLIVDGDGNLYVIDVLTSMYDLSNDNVWSKSDHRGYYDTRKSRATHMLQSTQQILNDKFDATVKSLSVFHIQTDNLHGILKIGDKRIPIELANVLQEPVLEYDVDAANEQIKQKVQSVNDLIDQYNSIEQSAKSAGVKFNVIPSMEDVTISNEDEYDATIDRLTNTEQMVSAEIERINKKINEANAHNAVKFYKIPENATIEQYPTTIQNILTQFEEVCDSMDALLDEIPDMIPESKSEVDNVVNLSYKLMDTQRLLNTILKHEEAQDVDVRSAEELIAKAIEKITKNKNNFSSFINVNHVQYWWLLNFQDAGASNTVYAVGGQKVDTSGYFINVIASWTNTLNDYVINGLEDLELISWYNTLLNQYFANLLQNATKQLEKVKNDRVKSELNVRIALGKRLVDNFNLRFAEIAEEYDVSKGEFESEADRINAIPVRWVDLYGPTDKHTLGLDKMSNNPYYYYLSKMPDLPSNLIYTFRLDASGNVVVDLRYKNSKQYAGNMSFETDTSLYKDESDRQRAQYVNRHNKKFIDKIKAMIEFVAQHPEYEISCQITTDKGSVNYAKDGSTYHVTKNLFAGRNSQDLYTIKIGPGNIDGTGTQLGIAKVTKYADGTTGLGVYCGTKLDKPIRAFARDELKDAGRIQSGSLVYNYDTGDNQKIPVPMNMQNIGADNIQIAQNIANLLIMLAKGDSIVDGYQIKDLLKMFIYFSEDSEGNIQSRKYNNDNNKVTVQNGKIYINNKECDPNLLAQRLANMGYSLNAEICNESIGTSQFSVFADIRSRFAAGEKEVVLPTGHVIKAEDVTKNNGKNQPGSTWLGYMMRNGMIRHCVKSEAYKQINFGNPKLVLKMQSEEQLADQFVEETKEQLEEKLNQSIADLFDFNEFLPTMTIEDTDAVQRTYSELEQFKQTVSDYFSKVLGMSKEEIDQVFDENILKPVGGTSVVVGICTDSMIKLSKYAPDSAMFHEAFHKVLELMIPAEKREQFYNMYRQTYDNETLTDRQVAEGLADMFTDYMQHKMDVKRSKGIGKLYKMFKRLAFNIGMTWKLGIKNAIKTYKFYRDVNRGAYANAEITDEARTRFKTLFGESLHYEVKNKETGRTMNFDHIKNSTEKAELVRALGWMIGRQLKIHDPLFDPANLKVRDTIARSLMYSKDEATKTTIRAMIQMSPAMAEVFTEEKREKLDKDGNVVLGKNKKPIMESYYPKFDVLFGDIMDYFGLIVGDYRFKFKAAPEDEELEGDANDAGIYNKYDRSAAEFSRLDSMTERVKLFFATFSHLKFGDPEKDKKTGEIRTPMKLDSSKNLFGAPSYMRLEEVFNVIVAECHDAISPTDLLAKLLKLRDKSPIFAQAYNKFSKLMENMYTYDDGGNLVSVNYDKESYAILIVKCIHSEDLDFLVVRSKLVNQSKRLEVTRTSSDRDSRSYPNIWEGYLTSGQVGVISIDKTEDNKYKYVDGKSGTFKNISNQFSELNKQLKSTSDVITFDGKEYDIVDPSQNRKLKQSIVKMLNSIGIMIEIDALDAMLYDKHKGADADGVRSWLTVSDETSVLTFIEALKNAEDKDGNVSSNKAVSEIFNRGFVRNLGNAQGQHARRTKQRMALALNGKKLYNVSQNSSLSHIKNQLNTLNENNETVSTLSKFGFNLMSRNGVSVGSIILKQIKRAVAGGDAKQLQMHTIVGYRSDNRGDGGNEYTKTAKVDDYIEKYALLRSGYMISPTLADKGTYVVTSGVEIPGMVEHGMPVLDRNGNKTDVMTYTVDNVPTVDFVGGQWVLIPSNAVLDQMIEYAYTERQAIQECMEDLGYTGIDGYVVQGRKKLTKGELIKNYHTPHKDKATKKTIEPNGTRFWQLKNLVTLVDGLFVDNNLNDPNESSMDLLKRANELFFSKPLEEQRRIMAYTLHKQSMLEVQKAVELGIVDRHEIKVSGALSAMISASDQGFANLTTSHLDQVLIDTIADMFLKQQRLQKAGWNDIANKTPAQLNAYKEVCRSLAIAALLLDTTHRSIISSQEFIRCFSGHPAMFKVQYDVANGRVADDTFDIQKRIGGLVSTGDDNVYDQIPGLTGKYVCAEIDDYEVGSTANIKPQLARMFEESAVREMYAEKLVGYEKAYARNEDGTFVISLEEIYKNVEHSGYESSIEKAKNDAKSFASAYDEGINVADGAAYISALTCKDMLRMNGGLSKKAAKAFLILEDESSKYSWVDRRDAFKDIYDEVNLVSTKYTAYGFRDHTLNGESVTDIAVPYYNKFALFPIFPCLATQNLGRIYDKMLVEGVDMLIMNSGVKVGSQGSIGYGGSDESYSIDNMLSKPFNKYVQSFAYLRKQQNTDPEEGDTARIGTQMIKIGLQNLRLDRYYTDAKTGKLIKGSDLFRAFMDNIEKLSDIGMDKIKDMFFNESGNSVDPKKLSDYLKRELLSRNANRALIEAIEYDEKTGKLVAPLAATPDAMWIESILISTINKHVIDIVTPGSSFVQRSVFAMEAEGDEGSIQGVDSYNGKKLLVVNEEGSMDALISIDYFENILPKGLSFKEARQWLIDNGIIGDNASANTIGYRIPTQAQSSIHALRFIDVVPAVKSTVILPQEFTKTTGSDFDIDHLYLATLNYDVIDLNKDLTSVGLTEKLDQSGKIATEDVTKEEKQCQNDLLYAMLTLLKDTGNSMHCLFKSIDNDTALPKAVSDQISHESTVKAESYNFGSLHEQVDRKTDYITGKTGIGPFALNVTNQVLTYLTGVKFDGWADPSSFAYRTGFTGLDKLYDNNDNAISSWLSGFINAHVDIVKDPWISRLNVNKFTYNMINLFARTGQGEEGLWFLCQPVIKSLAEAEDKVNGMFTRSKGDGGKKKIRKDLRDAALGKYNIKLSEETEEMLKSTSKKTTEMRVEIVKFMLKNMEAMKKVATSPVDPITGIPTITEVDAYDGHQYRTMSVEEFQSRMYQAWVVLSTYSDALSELVSTTKIDTRKHGKNLIQISSYEYKYDKLFHPTTEDGKPSTKKNSVFDTGSLNNLIYSTWIEYKTRRAISLPKLILGQQTFNGNGAFVHAVIMKALEFSTDEDASISEKVVNTISQNLQTAVKSRYMVAWYKQTLGKTDLDISKLFLGSTSIKARLDGIKIKIATDEQFAKKYGENALFRSLISQERDEKVTNWMDQQVPMPLFITVTDNVDGSKFDEDALIDSWSDLLESEDPEMKEFAQDLVVYTFLTSGEGKGWNKLFKYVPSDWLLGNVTDPVKINDEVFNSFSEYVQYVLSNEDMEDLVNDNIDDVLSNNSDSYELIPTISNKMNGEDVFHASSKSNVLITKPGSLVDYPYIRVKGAIYKNKGNIVGADKKVRVVYMKMPQLGHKDFNNVIYQYGWTFYRSRRITVPGNANEYMDGVYDQIMNFLTKYSKNAAMWDNFAAADKYMDNLYMGRQQATPVQQQQQATIDKKWVRASRYYTRQSVQNDPRTLYIFTDNTDRTSGGTRVSDGWYKEKYGDGGYGSENNPTSAIIRGLENAYPISTMRYFYKDHPGMSHPKYNPDSEARWHDKDFNEFKRVFDDEIAQIKAAWDSGKYDKMVSPVGDQGKSPFFGSERTGITPERTPKIYAYMMDQFAKLAEYVENGNLAPESEVNLVENNSLDSQGLPITAANNADEKAEAKASIATQFIGFADGIQGSSTAKYAQQAGDKANTGNYSSSDVIFVSIPGKRGDAAVRKQQQDRTIRETIKALEAGATILTDNEQYVAQSEYNEGEKRLNANLKHFGYVYSERVVDGHTIGVWNKPNPETQIDSNAGTDLAVFSSEEIAQGAKIKKQCKG